ncbi:arsenate reductase family protein [Zobellia galactanivorans]|uniref:arsenate reductase family protein n=1 Tax=Zobellia galactanivorans (strain DSM 12802 / CCUG 47099 / CIP 106680 / NCIMB 13871 / Dsij) TaxID=63186 RepID=UPI001C067E59|nr:hypothetical protein [Zobellia galactanivorans]MBU3025216.1 hypothetical protein [Zobellia galactanivorans]
MSVFAKNKRQISYIYSSESDLGRKVLGYVEGMVKKIRTVDISRDNLGNTIWTEISEMLGMPFEDFLATEHPSAPEIVKGGSFDTTGWLKILGKNPFLLQKPIAIVDNKAKLIESRADILSFYGVDSAGLEQSPLEGRPEIFSKTEKETFVPEIKKKRSMD